MDSQRKREKERERERKREKESERERKREKERERERKRGDLDHLSVHQGLRSTIPDSQQPISPIGFLFLKLPPLPCAVLLVSSKKLSLSQMKCVRASFWQNSGYGLAQC